MHRQPQDLHPSEFDALDRRLLDTCQRDMPICARPYQRLAERLGTTEHDLIHRLERLHALGVISRAGAVFDHARAGASLLAAVAVPHAERDAFAALINRSPGVNHNYAREAAHGFNLWFVMTAPDDAALEERLEALEQRINRLLLRLPMRESFHIDLAFPLPWAEWDSAERDRTEAERV